MQSGSLSPISFNPVSMPDMILIQTLIDHVQNDQNLSALPDDFKKLAVQTMFDDAKRLEHEQEQGIDTSNKRLRVEDMME